MINETEASAPTSPSESSWWCTKLFEYVKNRNRIGPGKIELPDCDFFIVGPRRTLRVLVPVPRGNVYYETTRTERPETIDENFVSRWASRPHPSGNCRCSFRQSKNRLSTSEERMISNEINRIRTSLCEAEKSGEDIEKLEQRISRNLEVLTTEIETKNSPEIKITEIPILPTVDNDYNDKAIKKKIVKDLELYIERSLSEVLNDTMKFFNDAGDTLKKSHEVLRKTRKCSCESICIDPKHLQTCESLETVERSMSTSIDEISTIVDKEESIFTPPTNSFEINFAFHEKEMEKTRNEKENAFVDLGYVNRGFSGTPNDPDSLDFVLQKPTSNEIEHLDCIDSGINSVETMEFQTSQEPSLEESLMEIIDAKFGRVASKRSWQKLGNLETMENDEIINDEEKMKNVEITKNNEKIVKEIEILEKNDEKELSRCSEKETLEKNKLTIKIVEETKCEIRQFNERVKENVKDRNCDENLMELEETRNEPNFDKLRLELLETPNSTKKLNGMAALREKFNWKLSNGCKDRENVEKKTKNERPKSESSPIVELRIKNDKISHEIRESSVDGIHDDVQGDIVKYRKFRKPTIVFLHGFGSSAEIFENQLEYFSNLGYPCIAPEILGHGLSSAPDRSRDYHFDKLLKDLELVLQHYAFGAGRKCVLVAHNYGCSFATALACKYDSNIHQLVLISGGGPTPLAPPSNEGAGHCCLRAMLTPLLMCGLHRDILYSARGRQHPYCGPEPIGQWPSHMKYVLDGMVWPEGDCVFHRRIITPTLLIHGLRDDKVSLVQECQMERTIIKAFLDAIPTAGHTPMIDCPEQVNHMIHCFIDLWKRKKR